jgi:hypothetical protein
MASSAKRPKDEFAVAMVVLFFLPLLPLIMELLLTVAFNPHSQSLLEKNSVMVTAPMFAVGVGMASRFKGVFGFALLVAGCLAVMYGAQTMQNRGGTGSDSKISQRAGQGSGAAGAGLESSNQLNDQAESTITSRIGMSDLPVAIAWYGMICMTLALIVERAIRHLMLAEPYEFEWNK